MSRVLDYLVTIDEEKKVLKTTDLEKILNDYESDQARYETVVSKLPISNDLK
ncbi:hypothetical protein ACRASX_10445 [Flavobacterium sp. TMP13]|uniref:hypothetical protein n=1 Tax=Flavobacterium sp. TMP13 TaxID=3425950 RepID=UPI003D7736A1